MAAILNSQRYELPLGALLYQTNTPVGVKALPSFAGRVCIIGLYASQVAPPPAAMTANYRVLFEAPCSAVITVVSATGTKMFLDIPSYINLGLPNDDLLIFVLETSVATDDAIATLPTTYTPVVIP